MLSLQYGHGDTRWFNELPRDEQARLLAYLVVEREKPGRTRDPRDPDADRLHQEADDAAPKSATDVLRARMAALRGGGR